MAFDDYYASNPIGVIDQNTWTDKDAGVMLQFQTGPTIFTPLVDWTNRSQATGAQYSQFTELLEGEADTEELTMTQQYITEPLGLDSRMFQITTARYGDKVQFHESENIFQQWQFSGGRDWRPLLRGALGSNVRRKIEILSRNAFLKGPKTHWTYAGDATSMAELDASCKFSLSAVNGWNLRLGNTGSPIIPGTAASAKLAILPPGAIYDFQESLAGAATSEAQMWRDAAIYSGEKLQYEIGNYKNIRFQETPNDKYGQNISVLYNAGKVEHQAAATVAIAIGDGAPDPETTKVDETWYVGQKGATHYITCAGQDLSGFAVGDIVSIHTSKTSAYGDADGVNFLHGRTITRRIVSVNDSTDRIAFDRPILFNYSSSGTLTPKGNGSVTGYAYITKATHIGLVLVLGSRGGILGNVNRPMKFYEPKPVDDFESVWRYVWDIIAGYNVVNPDVFEVHLCAVTLPKAGGVIAVPAHTS